MDKEEFMDKVFTELIAKMLGTPAEQAEQALIEVKDKMRDFFDKVKQQIQKNDE